MSLDWVDTPETGTRDVEINRIRLNGWRRDLRDVSELMGSMARVGLINPLTVTSDLRLVAGLHRLEAAKRLGWTSVKCSILSGSEIEAELASIDENLIRNELNIVQQGRALKRREELLTALGQRAESGLAASRRTGATVAPVKTTAGIASEIGLSERSAQERLQIAKSIPDDVLDVLEDSSIANSTTELVQLARMPEEMQRAVVAQKEQGERRPVRRIAKKIEREQEDAARAQQGETDSLCEIRLGDFRNALADVPSDSVDAIITDPPYGELHLPLWSDLSLFASRVLKPGGVLAAISGQSYLPEVLKNLGEHLDYQWVICYLTPGGQSAQIWPQHVNTFWKPVVLFGRGPRKGARGMARWIGDVTRSVANDKDHHPWGQSESGMLDLIARLSEPGDLVVDPFAGAGTTGVACREQGRRFIGIEIDRDHANTAARRIGCRLQGPNAPAGATKS